MSCSPSCSWGSTLRLDALDGIIDEARAASATLGRRVRVEMPGDSFDADAVDLTAEGHLRVQRDDGREVTISAADVVHLRPRPA